MMSRLTQILKNTVRTKIKRKESKKLGGKENEKIGLTPRSDRAKVLKGTFGNFKLVGEIIENFNCRICIDKGDDPNQDICTPCSCSGSIKYVHVDCLKAWMKEKGSIECEICHMPYKPMWKKWALESNILKFILRLSH